MPSVSDVPTATACSVSRPASRHADDVPALRVSDHRADAAGRRLEDRAREPRRVEEMLGRGRRRRCRNRRSRRPHIPIAAPPRRPSSRGPNPPARAPAAAPKTAPPIPTAGPAANGPAPPPLPKAAKSANSKKPAVRGDMDEILGATGRPEEAERRPPAKVGPAWTPLSLAKTPGRSSSPRRRRRYSWSGRRPARARLRRRILPRPKKRLAPASDLFTFRIRWLFVSRCRSAPSGPTATPVRAAERRVCGLIRRRRGRRLRAPLPRHGGDHAGLCVDRRIASFSVSTDEHVASLSMADLLRPSSVASVALPASPVYPSCGAREPRDRLHLDVEIRRTQFPPRSNDVEALVRSEPRTRSAGRECTSLIGQASPADFFSPCLNGREDVVAEMSTSSRGTSLVRRRSANVERVDPSEADASFAP